MDCARNEKLLALHAGGDLPARQARALSAHLRACDACRRAASDFAAGRELLAAHEPPEFDAAFFDAVRRNVLREIDGDAPPPPAFARLSALLFGRRALALAACVAFLIVAAGAIVPYLRQGRGPAGDAPPQLAASGVETRQENGPAPGITPPPARADETETKTPAPVVASLPHRRHLGSSDRRAPRAKSEARRAEPIEAASNVTAETAEAHASNAASTRQEAAAASEVAELVAPAERKMLRIELQTGDPNVRIIWLTPQGPERLPR